MKLFNAPRALTVKSAAIPLVAGQAALLGIPVVEGDAAAVEIITDLRSMPQPEDMGRIVFFLNKTEVGWRIVNSLDFASWPITDGKCWGTFWRPPTPWQKQFEAPQCKPGFVDKEIH